MATNNEIKRFGTASQWVDVLNGDDYVLQSVYDNDHNEAVIGYEARIATLEGQVSTLISDLTTLTGRVDLHDEGVNQVGSFMLWGSADTGVTAPAGYIVADGIAKSRTVYADLFAEWGTLYGAGDGSTTFGIPNCTWTVPFGVAITDGTRNTSLGTGDQNASHKHNLNAQNLGNESNAHYHGVGNLDADNNGDNHYHQVGNLVNNNVTAWHTHNVAQVAGGNATKATGNPSANHKHQITGNTNNVSAWHNHDITGNTSNNDVNANANRHNHAWSQTATINNQTANHSHNLTVFMGTWLIKI